MHGMCLGNFTPDSGKFSQHCTDCVGLGKHAGDYRTAHCHECGKHYFAGSMGDFDCEYCERSKGKKKA